jgi:hypothetical protein
LCNQNNGNFSADIDILPSASIAITQGRPLKAAGNSFSATPNGVDYRNSGTDLITYYYYTAILAQNPTPVANVYKIGIDVAQIGCEIPDDVQLSDNDNIADIKSAYLIKKSTFAAALSNYQSLLDGGNTSGLLSQVQSATSSNAGSLKNILLSASPYLSESVLVPAFNRSDIFSTQTRYDLLAANPDVLKSGDMMYQVEHHEQPLSGVQIANLYQARQSSTARTGSAADLAWKGLEKDVLVHHGLSLLIADSIQNFTAIREWLGYLGSFVANLNIADTYLAEGNTSAWQQQLSSMTANGLSAEEITDLAAYTDYHTIILNAAAQQRNLTMLTPNEVSQLNTIALAHNRYVNSIVRNFLEAYYGYHFETADSADRLDTAPKNSKGISDEAKKEGQIVFVYPNPADGAVTFDISGDDISSKTIEVYNSFGRLVLTQTVTAGQYTLNCKSAGLTSGFYQYRLIQSGAILQSGKFIIR